MNSTASRMKVNFKTLLFRWGCVVAWCCLIFYLSSIPEPSYKFVPIYEFVARKFAHFVVYAILCFFFIKAFETVFVEKWRVSFWSIFLSIVYAILDEYHQGHVPGRFPSYFDIGIDSIGVLAGRFLLKK